MAIYFDVWGNLKGEPEKVIEETHGEDFIKVLVYKYNDLFYFSFQLRVGKVIRQKVANRADLPMRGIDQARQEARDMIIDICRKNHAIKKIFADFTVIRYNQPELFNMEV